MPWDGGSRCGEPRQERSRAVRFEGGAAKLRSLSCDDVLSARPRTCGEDEAEASGSAANGPSGRISVPPHLTPSPQQPQQPAGHHILVAVRCRPLHPQEQQAGIRGIVRVAADGKLVILEDPQTTAADDYLRLNKSKERHYAFDEAFDEHAATRQVYDLTTRFLIGFVLQGFNATVFAYGATGAGKTHTMLGSPAQPGIMLLTLHDLFAEVASQREERQFEVKCSFLEVYNENIRDLLRPDADYLDIREDPVKGMCVAGISEVGGLESAEEIMALLQQANRNRTTESTGANVTSSRSHAVLQVVVEQRDRTAGIVAQVNLGKLSMIDLAGSERASQTNNKGMRMIEGANINRSLLALGNCITALSSAVSFVPYRDSKMTRLLKDSLGGNCRTVMIANVSPSHLHYEDTHNTLKYANRAKNIKTKVVKNVVRVNYHVSKYTEIIKELRGEIAELKAKLASAPEGVPGTIGTVLAELPGANNGEDSDADLVHEQSAKWKQELMQNFEERVRIKRRLIDLAHEAKNRMVQKSHAQVGISQWESAQVSGDSSHQVATPQHIRELQEQLRIIKADMARTEETTRELEEMLLENQRKAEKLQAELPCRVQNKDMRTFLGLVCRIYEMEVENMDMQEMNEVTAPLLQQKDLEAEALRLQIRMRDRMIEDQDRLLGDREALLPKPEGWIEMSGPARRLRTPRRGLEEEHRGHDFAQEREPPPRRRHAAAASGDTGDTPPRRAPSAGPPTEARPTGAVVLPPLSPTGRGRFSQRGAPERGPPPDRTRLGSNLSSASGAAAAVRPEPGTPSAAAPADPSEALSLDVAGRGLGAPASLRPDAPVRAEPPWPARPGDPLAPPPGDKARPLDVAGRGLGLVPMRPEPAVSPTPWPAVVQPPVAAAAPGQRAADAYREGDADTPRLPAVEGHQAAFVGIRGPPGNQQFSDGRNRPPVLAALRLRKKHRRISGLYKDKDRDNASQCSDTEQGRLTPIRHSARGPRSAPAVERRSAAERRGIIERLNRRMKPGCAPVPTAKNLY